MLTQDINIVTVAVMIGAVAFACMFYVVSLDRQHRKEMAALQAKVDRQETQIIELRRLVDLDYARPWRQDGSRAPGSTVIVAGGQAQWGNTSGRDTNAAQNNGDTDE